MTRRLATITLITATTLALMPTLAPGGTSPTVYVTDNAFVRGVNRPTVKIRVGQSVTWRWASQQSHGVSVRSGPARFVIAVRTRGRVAHRFARSGTYRLECQLHAPGMKMTVVVRR